MHLCLGAAVPTAGLRQLKAAHVSSAIREGTPCSTMTTCYGAVTFVTGIGQRLAADVTQRSNARTNRALTRVQGHTWRMPTGKRSCSWSFYDPKSDCKLLRALIPLSSASGTRISLRVVLERTSWPPNCKLRCAALGLSNAGSSKVTHKG